jgi:5-methylcytosine-specific restriction endonuclease McrA
MPRYIRKCELTPAEIRKLKEAVLSAANRCKLKSRNSKQFITIKLRDTDIVVNKSRYLLFFTKGVVCRHCGIVGVRWVIEKYAPTPKIARANWHINLYGLDKNGMEIPLTLDHIKAKKHGGKNEMDNYQVLCSPCNSLKDATIPVATTKKQRKLKEKQKQFKDGDTCLDFEFKCVESVLQAG